MAIPFNFPPEDDTARLERTLELLLVDLFEVLRQLAPPPAAGNATTAAATYLPAATAAATEIQQHLIAPVAVALRSSQMSDLVPGIKTRSSSETTTTSTSAAAKRQSWQQLGSELRVLADQFSSKQTDSTHIAKCGNNPTSGKSSRTLAEKVICMLLPKTLSYSAATVIFVGLRLFKSKFA